MLLTLMRWALARRLRTFANLNLDVVHVYRQPHVQRQSPACQTVLDTIGDLLADRRQLKRVFFQDRIVRLLGKFPICGRLAP